MRGMPCIQSTVAIDQQLISSPISGFFLMLELKSHRVLCIPNFYYNIVIKGSFIFTYTRKVTVNPEEHLLSPNAPILCSADLCSTILTLAAPHRLNNFVLHAKNNGGHDDGGQGRLGDEGALVHEEGEAEDDQRPGVHTAQWGPHPARAVHRSPGEGARGRHRADEGAHHVANAERDHLLAGVHRLSPGCGLLNQARHSEVQYCTHKMPWQWRCSQE